MKNKNQETLISRIMILLVGFVALSVLAFLYIMPFFKTSLQINYFYKVIEYSAMGVTGVLFVASLVLSKLKKGKTADNAVITPAMLTLLSASAFGAAVAIPLSADRMRYCHVSVIAFVFVFIAYATYHLVNKAFAYQSVVCGIYFIILKLFGDYYSAKVTFSDKINVDYTTARLAIALVIIVIILVTLAVARRVKDLKLWHTALLSMVPAAALIARVFVTKYVVTVAFIVLGLVFAALVITTKLAKK